MPYRDVDPTTVSWTRWSARDVRDAIRRAGGDRRLAVCAIDGHSGAGKSTQASLIAGRDPRVAVVHTDDLAWHHSFFDWASLLIDHVLAPVRDGRLPVEFRPPSWQARGREGAVSVPADSDIVLVEGVGAARREARPYLDYVIWVHVPEALGRRRLIAKGSDSEEFIDRWMAEENIFLADHQPWAAADLVIDGRRSAWTGGDE